MLWAPPHTPPPSSIKHRVFEDVFKILCNGTLGLSSQTRNHKGRCQRHVHRRGKPTTLNLQLTFSGSWDSTSFFSLLSKKGLNTLCRRLMIKIVSSSFRSTYKTTLDEFVKDASRRETLLHSRVSMHTEISRAIEPGGCQPATPPSFLPTCLPHGNKMTAK